MTNNKFVDSLVEAWESLMRTIKDLANSIGKLFSVVHKADNVKTRRKNPRQYGMSLMNSRYTENKVCKPYRIKQQTKKHLPYQRRAY